jgi:SAM-dependent methyltransferase
VSDGPGAYDLDELAKAHRLQDWMWEAVGRRDMRRVVEVGPGIGTFCGRILEQGAQELLLVEPDPALAAVVGRRFADDPRVTLAVEGLPGSAALAARAGRADWVLCQNVLEHVEDDAAAMVAMARALRRGGTVTVLVPAHPLLMNSLDRTYGHARRYTRARLQALARAAGLDVDELRSFNLLGIPGWLVRGWMRATSLGHGSLRAYEAILPAWRPVERRLKPPWGLSLVLQARRP